MRKNLSLRPMYVYRAAPVEIYIFSKPFGALHTSLALIKSSLTYLQYGQKILLVFIMEARGNTQKHPLLLLYCNSCQLCIPHMFFFSGTARRSSTRTCRSAFVFLSCTTPRSTPGNKQASTHPTPSVSWEPFNRACGVCGRASLFALSYFVYDICIAHTSSWCLQIIYTMGTSCSNDDTVSIPGVFTATPVRWATALKFLLPWIVCNI